MVQARALALLVLSCVSVCARADEEYEFWDASAAGDVGAMTALLAAHDLDLEYHDDDGRSPLMLAVLGGHVSAVRLLLERGADVEATGRWPGPEDGPLSIAGALGATAVVDALLAGGAAVNAATGPDGRTPLMVAAAAGQLESVDAFLGVGADVDARRRDGTTAACWAARHGHAAILQLLLDHGADVHVHDELDGSTPLHFAAQSLDGAVTRAALDAGADVFSRTSVMAPKGPRPGSEEAAAVPAGVTMSTLGADGLSTTAQAKTATQDGPYEPTREELRGGLTPLMSAAAAASTEGVKVILEFARGKAPSLEAFQDQYVNAVDVSGMTALAWACSVPNGPRSVETMELLVAAGARDDSLTVDGRALLHVAAAGANGRAIAWLVDTRRHFVDVRSPSKGHTPLLIAAFTGARASSKALLRRGADVNAEAPDGATPLIAAASGCHKGVAKLLLKRGADALARLKSGEFPSQVTPKTPEGKMLKWALSKAERKAWVKLEAEVQAEIEAESGAPPEQETGIDDELIEDLDDERPDDEDDEEDDEAAGETTGDGEL